MKSVIIFLLFVHALASAQSFSGRTNDVIINYKQGEVKSNLPFVAWLFPRMEYTNGTSNSVEVEAEIKSDVPIKSITLKIDNGTSMRGGTKAVSLGDNKFNHPIRQKVSLMDGQNEISIIVENENGGKVSSSRFVTIGKDALANAIDMERTDYALFFATNKYDEWDDLNNPVFDAKTIETMLKEKYGFKTELLEDPTQEEILGKIYEYNARTFRPQDQLLIFFAGHGFFDENLGEGFVVARNSLLNDLGKGSYIPHSILRQRVENIKSEHIFLVMDVCFGGTLDPVFSKSRGDSYSNITDTEFLIRKLSKRTRKFLTSGGKQYVPDGTPGSHSPFAAKFIQALKERGGTENGMITISDFQRYLQKLSTEPRLGKFSDTDDPASDFVFVSKQ